MKKQKKPLRTQRTSFRVGGFGDGAIRGRRCACPRLFQSRPSACNHSRRFCHGPDVSAAEWVDLNRRRLSSDKTLMQASTRDRQK